MKKIIFSSEEVKEIIYLYTVQNISMSKIGKQFNVNHSVIRKILKENNIEIYDNNRYKSKSINENYFEKIDNQNKAYILGYIYADGCLTKGNNLSFSCCFDNLESLQIIKNELQSEHKICKDINHSSYCPGATYYKLSIVNQKIYNDLIQLGVEPRKTFSCSFPDISKVPEEFVRHFIRGYFDGNGSIFCYSKTNAPMIGFTSGSKDILEGIKIYLSNYIGTKAQILSYKDRKAFDYKIGGRKQIEKIYHYFYDDAFLFLGRKKEKFEKILNIK